MTQSLRRSNFKGAPDAAMRCWRPLSKTSNRAPVVCMLSEKFSPVNPRDSSFGNVAACAYVVVLAGCTGVRSLLSSFRFLLFLLDPAFVTVGAVRARTRLLIPCPTTCIVVTFVQKLKSSTQFMSITILVAVIEMNSRFEIGNILHACLRRSVRWPGLE